MDSKLSLLLIIDQTIDSIKNDSLKLSLDKFIILANSTLKPHNQGCIES